MQPVTSAPGRPGEDLPANLDSVRGLACLLVVALHVIGDSEANGLRLPMSSGWHYAMMSIEFIRMPLFTALSGYLYAGNRVSRVAFGRFWVKKARRLGVPLVCVTAVMWVLLARTDAEPIGAARAFLFSFGHLWYVQALILLFVAVSVCDAVFRPGCAVLTLAGLAAIMVDQSGWTVTSCFSLDGAFYLAPYFLFGMILRENPAWLRDRSFGWMALGIVAIVLSCQQLGLAALMVPVTALQLPAALAGMAAVVFLLQRFPRSRLLAGIGTYSYTIYLWHVTAGAAARTVLVKAGVAGVPVLFPPIFAASIALPVVLYHIARRVPLFSVAVTGEPRRARDGRFARPFPRGLARRSATVGTP
jgi:peptidoglycan/LPS O-acetylase OafA/YrhL